jgi:hypothetical protein
MEHIHLAGLGPTAPRARTLDLWRVLAACLAKAAPEPVDVVARIVDAPAGQIALTEMVAFEALARRVEGGQCAAPSVAQALSIGRAMLAGTQQGVHVHQVWRTRYSVARLLAAQDTLDEAVSNAEAAWRDSAWNSGVGILVFQLHASRNDRTACARTLEKLRERAGRDDLALARALDQFQQYLDEDQGGRAGERSDSAS